MVSYVFDNNVNLYVLFVTLAVLDPNVNDLKLFLFFVFITFTIFVTGFRCSIQGKLGIKVSEFAKVQANVVAKDKAVVRLISHHLVHAMGLKLRRI